MASGQFGSRRGCRLDSRSARQQKGRADRPAPSNPRCPEAGAISAWRTGTSGGPWRRPYFLRSTTRLSRVRKPPFLRTRAQLRLVIGQRLGDAVAHRAGLAGQAAAGDGGDDVVLAVAVGGDDRLLQDHLQHRTGEILGEFLAVDGDAAGARLQPDAGDGVLALAGGIGAAVGVELLDIDRRAAVPSVGRRGPRGTGDRRPWSGDPRVLGFSAATSSGLGLLRLMRMLGAGIDAQILQLRRPSGPRGIMRSTAFSRTRSGNGPRGSGARCAP